MLKKIIKLLRLKQLNAAFNYNTAITLNGKKFNIPVVRNMGRLNLSLKQNTFLYLLNKLKPEPGRSFIDVGVNVGQTLLMFRSCCDNPYWGFEPNPACVYYLNTLIKRNRFGQVHIIPAGLSSSSSIERFYHKGEADSAATIVKELRPGYYNAAEEGFVPLFSFDLLGTDFAGSVSLIKIDVEGAEFEVISGMMQTVSKHRPHIICEILDCHSVESIETMQERANRLVALIKGAGYQLYRIHAKGNKALLQEINSVKLKLWTPESFHTNDYLFVHQSKTNVTLLFEKIALD